MATLKKIDLYKEHKAEYAARQRPALINVGSAQYLAVAGQGAPGGDAFGAAIGALYAAAFTIKMTRKFAGLQDYAVCKLEGRYFFKPGQLPADVPKERWKWQLMIRTPEAVKSKDLRQALATLEKRGKGAGVKDVSLETVTEGRCVQMLHVGPYEREEETIAAMKAFAEERGLAMVGPHHEIYLSDPRRVPPERLKTILREPVSAK